MQLIEKAMADNKWIQFAPKNTSDGADWEQVLNGVITIILTIAGALAVIYLIYSGILYITAAGNPDQAKKGQQGVINAVIGIVIIVAVYFIINVAMNLGTTFG